MSECEEKSPKLISPNRRILKLNEIIEIYAMSRSSIYRAMEHDGFPKPIKLTGRSIGWSRESIEAWFTNRPSGIAPCADSDQYQTQAYLTSRPSADANVA